MPHPRRHEALFLLGDPLRKLVSQPPEEAIDGDVPYGNSWSGLVPAKAGVYLIRDLRGLLYIGHSSDLHRRFRQHRRNSHNSLLRLALSNPWGELRFAWIVDSEPAVLEAQLIERLRPICNRRRWSSAEKSTPTR